MISKYYLSERKAMLDHRYYLSISLGREASVQEVLLSWESGLGSDWRRDKMRRDCADQYQEILRHKWLLSENAGRDVGEEFAARDWVLRHARAWRCWREQAS